MPQISRTATTRRCSNKCTVFWSRTLFRPAWNFTNIPLQWVHAWYLDGIATSVDTGDGWGWQAEHWRPLDKLGGLWRSTRNTGDEGNLLALLRNRFPTRICSVEKSY